MKLGLCFTLNFLFMLVFLLLIVAVASQLEYLMEVW